jgi:hypothetical protein
MPGSAQRPKKPESGDGCVSRMLNLQLQKYPTPDFEETREIPPTSQRAFLNRECASSNPPRSARQSGNWRLYSEKWEPANGGLF